MLRLCQNFGTTSFFYSQDKEYSLVHIIIVQWKNTGGLKQKHKKQPFGDASASHLSLVLWHV